jgi:enoyl-CoA hydratase
MTDVTTAADQDHQGLVITRTGAMTRITLDRPDALNAISRTMRAELARTIRAAARDPEIYGVVIDATGTKAFSVGGDVRELLDDLRGGQERADTSLADEYALNWLLECFSKPTVALVDGIAMGTGVGVSHYATHRVAGPRYAFAMPETAIGFFPDDGVTHLLARLPDQVGLYLALTGRRIGRADAFRLGLVTHCIGQDRFEFIRTRLADADPVDALLDPLHEDPGNADLDGLRGTIAHCFSGETLGSVMDRLDERARGTGEDAPWCATVAAELRQKSPLALAVTLRHLRDARALDLRQVLMIDHRLGCRLVALPDFAEGVRAALIDKDRKPRWTPTRIEDVTEAMVDRCFATMPAALVLPTRQEMQAQRI